MKFFSVNYYKPHTTVRLDKLGNLLRNHPDKKLVNKLVWGFTFGFSLGYEGILRDTFAENLKSARDRPDVLRDKILKEVHLGRVLGPFSVRPIPNLIISPRGFVHKSGSVNDFRCIFHLSWPPGMGVNQNIPESKCSANSNPLT